VVKIDPKLKQIKPGLGVNQRAAYFLSLHMSADKFKNKTNQWTTELRLGNHENVLLPD